MQNGEEGYEESTRFNKEIWIYCNCFQRIYNDTDFIESTGSRGNYYKSTVAA